MRKELVSEFSEQLLISEPLIFVKYWNWYSGMPFSD